MPKLSICIPTFNRASHLENCLQSIIANRPEVGCEFQICVSDNCSTDETERVVLAAQQFLEIKYNKNLENLGPTRNFLKAVEMADGEFIWLLGDDDLLLPCALEKLGLLLDGHRDVDFFYINSSHLNSDYVKDFPQPFDTANLPGDMLPFSSRTSSGEMNFLDLVDPEISFDFLGGIFLSVFRRKNWVENVRVLDEEIISTTPLFSHVDNTFPHVKIFANAFAKSKAYYSAEPLSVCLTGVREWAPMYPLVRSVRLVEVLSEYRKNGLPLLQFLRCKNFALAYFLPDFVLMFLNKQASGYFYIRPWALLLAHCLYPNFYLSVAYYVVRKIKAKSAGCLSA